MVAEKPRSMKALTLIPLLLLCGGCKPVTKQVTVVGKREDVEILCTGKECVLEIIEPATRSSAFKLSGEVVAVSLWQTTKKPNHKDGWVKAIFRDGRHSVFSFTLRPEISYQHISKEAVRPAMRPKDDIVAAKFNRFDLCLVWKSGVVEWRNGGRFPSDGFLESSTTSNEKIGDCDDLRIADDLSSVQGYRGGEKILSISRPADEK